MTCETPESRGFPKTRNLKVTAGDGKVFLFWLSLDLTGYEARAQVKDFDGALLLDLSSPSGGLTVTPGVAPSPMPEQVPEPQRSGPWTRVTLTFTASQTRMLEGKYKPVFDLQLQAVGGDPKTYFVGSVTVRPDVTRGGP